MQAGCADKVTTGSQGSARHHWTCLSHLLSPSLLCSLPSRCSLFCTWLCFLQRTHGHVRDHEELWPHLWKALVAGPVQDRVQDFRQHETPWATVRGGWWPERCPGRDGRQASLASVCFSGSHCHPQEIWSTEPLTVCVKMETPFLALSQFQLVLRLTLTWGPVRRSKSPSSAYLALRHRSCLFSKFFLSVWFTSTSEKSVERRVTLVPLQGFLMKAQSEMMSTVVFLKDIRWLQLSLLFFLYR